MVTIIKMITNETATAAVADTPTVSAVLLFIIIPLDTCSGVKQNESYSYL